MDHDTGDVIPVPAQRAYLRAATVMDEVAPRCRLPWTLVAAVGRVESDHGRRGGAALDPHGVARPYFFGPTLDGRGPRARVPDSDHGGLDRNKRWDRAVGPMQLIPSTWSVVGVDGDGDGTRSPHDIDDAALAAAVHLCADSTHLTRPAHMRQALLRYNPSRPYVAAVRAYERRYRTYELAAMPPLATMVVPAVPAAPSAAHVPHRAKVKQRVTRVSAQHPAQRAAATRPEQPERPASPPGAETAAAPTTTPTTPTTPTTRETTRPAAGPTTEPATEPTTEPTTEPATEPTTEPTTEPSTEPSTEPTLTTVTVTGIWNECDAGYCLGDRVLDLSGADPTEPAIRDHDGDGVVRDNAAELLGLVGTTVELVALPQPTGLVVLAIDGTSVEAP